MNENKTLVVKYKEKTQEPPAPLEQVSISFDKNGGSGTMADITVNKGSAYSCQLLLLLHQQAKNLKHG